MASATAAGAAGDGDVQVCTFTPFRPVTTSKPVGAITLSTLVQVPEPSKFSKKMVLADQLSGITCERLAAARGESVPLFTLGDFLKKIPGLLKNPDHRSLLLFELFNALDRCCRQLTFRM